MSATVAAGRTGPAAGAGAVVLPGWERPTPWMLAILAGSGVITGLLCTRGPLAALAFVVAVGAALAVVRHPAGATIALVGLVAPLVGLRRGLPVPGLRISEILIFGVAVLVLLSARRSHLRRWGSVDWALTAYCLATLLMGSVNLVLRGEPFTLEFAGDLAGPLQLLLLYRVIVVALPAAGARGRALTAAMLGTCVVSSIALAQLAAGPALSDWLARLTASDQFAAGTEDGVERVTGAMSHPQPLSAYLFVMILLTASVALSRETPRSRRRLALATLVLAAAALLATATATPTIGAIIGVIALARMHRRGLVTIGTLIVVGAVLSVAMSSIISARVDQQFARAPGASGSAFVPQSVAYRYDVWTNQYLPALKGRLVLGYGPGIPPEVRWQFSETMYLSLLLRGGIILLSAWLIVVATLLTASARVAARTRGTPTGSLASALLVATALLVPMQLIQPYMLESGPAHAYWILAALVFAIAAPPRPRPARPGPAWG